MPLKTSTSAGLMPGSSSGISPSMRVLEKAGYECEGRLKKSVTKDGITVDQLIYATIR